jgi:hypothetical protein
MRKLIWAAVLFQAITWGQTNTIRIDSIRDSVSIGNRGINLHIQKKTTDTIYVEASLKSDKHWIAQKANYWGLEDWLIDVISLILLFSNVVLIVAVIRQLYWMKRTVLVAESEGKARDEADRKREAFEKSRLRARLNVEITPARVNVFSHNTQNEYFQIRVDPIVRNVGETAAEAINFSPKMPYMMPSDWEEIKTHIKAGVTVWRDLGIDFAHFEMVFPRTIPGNQTLDTISGETVTFLNENFESDDDGSTTQIYYSGFIKYRDVFNDVWVRKFIWLIRMDNTHSKVLYVHERYNVEERDDKWSKDR